MNKAIMVGKVSSVKDNWHELEIELLVTTLISKSIQHNTVLVKVSGPLKVEVEKEIAIDSTLEVHGALTYTVLPATSEFMEYYLYYIDAEQIIFRDTQMNEFFGEELPENMYLPGSPDYFNRILLSGDIVKITQKNDNACNILINVDDEIFYLSCYTAKASYIKRAYKPGDHIYAKCCYQSRVSNNGFEHKALIVEFYTKAKEENLTELDFGWPENPTRSLLLSIETSLYAKMNKKALDAGENLPRYILSMFEEHVKDMDDVVTPAVAPKRIKTVSEDAYKSSQKKK